MKKLYKFIILGALAVSVASCEKEISPIENGPDQGKQIRTEVIGVKTESEATKVTLSGTTFGWVDGDEIAVWAGTNAASGSFQDCEVSGGKISVTLGEGQARYNYAIYPAAVKDASNYGQGTLNVILPSSYTLAQVSGENTPLPMVAVNDKESSNLTFYNVAGLLRVTVKAIPSDATGLLFQFPGKKVNGTFAVTNPGAGTSTISNAAPGLGEDQITVTFAAGTASEMTLNIPLPTGDYDDVYITPVCSSTKVAAARHIKAGGYTATRARGRQLTATLVSFTVSSTEKVIFSPGNLWATNTTANSTEGWVWTFASHQYDIVGSNPANTTVGSGLTTSPGTIDLFGWVGNSSSFTGAAQYGINNSSTDVDYGNNRADVLKADWASLVISGYPANFWSTPSKGVYDYLRDNRSTTNSLSPGARYTLATINSIRGIIIFPDVYTHPSDVTVGGSPVYNANSNCTATISSTSDWDKMEAAGAVFLPAAGLRNGTELFNTKYGNYWMRESYGDGDYQAYYFGFGGDGIGTWGVTRRIGRSVRLVREL